MTIAVPSTGETFEAELEEDAFQCCGSNEPNRSGRRMGHYLLSAVLKIGWRIVHVSPEERRLLEAHGFGSGRLQ